jgi:hypothetical protein
MESGELQPWSLSAKGFLVRSIPVCLAYSSRASRINWKLGEDIVIEDIRLGIELKGDGGQVKS